MILLFTTKKLNNKDYLLNPELQDLSDRTAEFESLSQPVASFYTPTQEFKDCVYPLNVRELFPYWVRISNEGNSVLISLTEQYYKWLTCNINDINSVSFFRLEDLIDTENIPENLVEHLAYTYLNSLPKSSIEDGIVSPQTVKNLIDNVKVNLYSKKGSIDSFKLVINTFFGVDPDKITVSYPKKYILRLNSGRYEWMPNEPTDTANVTGYSEFYPNSSGSFLNYSVLYDNDQWQDFSYVISAPGVSLDYYNATVKPLVHPAGTKDFFNIRFDIPANPLNETTTLTEYEIPVLRNYALYTLGSTATIAYTFGCSGSYGGVTGYPSYVFPSWDEHISAYNFAGMSFADIIFDDFRHLKPLTGYTYPNEGLTCG